MSAATSVIEPGALEALVGALRGAATAWSGRRCATARSSTTRSTRPPTCRSAGPTSRTAARYRLERRDDEALLRLRGRPALVEAVPAPAAAAALAGAAATATARSRSSEEPRRRAAARVHRRALLRAARDRDPGPRASSAAAYVDRDYAARREDAFIVAVNCGEAGGTCFCVSMDTGPKADGGLRPRADRDARRRRHRFLVEVGSERGAEVLAELPQRAPPSADDARGRGARRRARRRADGPRSWTPTDITELLYAQPRASALGRGRRALPDLRQLHDGLPDLLLHDGRGRDRPRPARTPSARSAGTPASPSTSPTSTAAASAPSRDVALPPVDDPQARRPGSTSSAPRAASAAAAASPGARSAIDITEEVARDPRDRREEATR